MEVCTRHRKVGRLNSSCWHNKGFATIYEGIWTDVVSSEAVPVAIKVIIEPKAAGKSETLALLDHEMRVWHSLSHANIVPFLGVCCDIDRVPAMVSPLYRNDTVDQYIIRCPQADRLAIVTGLARGLEYIHSNNVIHGDVKSRNVLIDDEGIPRITDFGRSKFIGRREYFTIPLAGSPRYMAPELTAEPDEDAYEARENGALPNVTKQTDVFAFAMVALEVLTGRLPFYYVRQDMQVAALLQDGRRPDRSKCSPETFTDTMWALMAECWTQDPRRRPDMGMVVQHLAPMTTLNIL